MLYRQGDLFIEATEVVPEGATQRAGGVLLEGELTGHSHRIEDLQSAIVHERLGQMFIEVRGEQAAVIHQEHGTIVLPRGVYRAWRQREYVAAGSRPSRAIPKDLPVQTQYVRD
jgi:hypothetical protein